MGACRHPAHRRSQGPRLAGLNARRRNASPTWHHPQIHQTNPSRLLQRKKVTKSLALLDAPRARAAAQRQNKQRRLCRNSVRNGR
jgi:hypothetical protein